MADGKVYIDGRMLGEGGTGVATYARTLVAAVAETGRPTGLIQAGAPIGAVRRYARAIQPFAFPLRSMGSDLVARDVFRVAQRRFDLTGSILRLKAPGPPAIVHWTYPVPIAIEGWANIYTIHDVIPLARPDLSPIDPQRHRRLLDAVGRQARRIVTVTEAARADILATLGWPSEMVVNCGQAVMAPTAFGALPEGLSDRGYFLFCGRIEARKNLGRLIRAHTASRSPLPLILAGPLAEGGEAVLAAAEAAPNVRYLGYVDRPVLAGMLAHARALLLPSLLEGFGLPVVEAMTLGTPVLISRDKALVEVAGGAALEVDGGGQRAMSEAILTLSDQEDLRRDLIARGRKRSVAFSLDRWAARLDDIYRIEERAPG